MKGLDISLLQQNKARAAQSTDDDDSLEQVFQQVTTESSVPKKRTREDFIKELKEKRQKGGDAVEVVNGEAVSLEEAKKAGKFKPIGFKPIGAAAEGKGKTKRTKDADKDAKRKKKKRKVEGDTTTATQDVPQTLVPNETLPVPPPEPEPEPEPEPIPEDFDIFAGAGEYEGIDLGDDDEDDGAGEEKTPEINVPPEPPVVPRGGWFDTEYQDKDMPPQPNTTESHVKTNPSPPLSPAHDEDEAPEQVVRLVPLQSSAIPSIRDLLAMDDAQGNRSKRKDKKKGGKDQEDKKKATAEAKAERDYKRWVFRRLGLEEST